MIDAHQDLFARLNCGEGMPHFYSQDIIEDLSGTKDGIPPCVSSGTDWFFKPLLNMAGFCLSIQDFGYRLGDDGLPLVEDCQKVMFGEYYKTTETAALFEALYTNKLQIRDKFVAFWDVVAKRLAENEYIVGFDPINEPFPASIYRDPFLI